MPDRKPAANLRTVAKRVGLAPCSVSAILNNTTASHSIPQSTKDRVFRAVAELNYRPNLWARSLRTKRTRMVAAVTPDFGRGAVARVVAGVQRQLQRRGYLLALGSLDTAPNVAVQFQQRGIEGVIAIDATLPRQLELPVASIDLSYMLSLGPMNDGMQAWLSELGESAAETIIRQIERQSVSRRVKVDAIPPAYFELPNVRMESSAVARESA